MIIASQVWQSKVKNNTSDQSELVDAHLPLVRHIALRLSRSLPPSFPLEDLVQEGVIGLMRAATQYDPAAHHRSGFPKPVPFVCFARQRIRGAMLDSVGGRHWTANTHLPLDTGEPGDGPPEAACAPAQAHQAQRYELVRQVHRAATWLSADQRRIVSMRYGTDEMDMPAIAHAMGKSLRWVYGRHNAAIRELQFRLGARNGAENRLEVVPLKPAKTTTAGSVAAAAALETDRKKNLDELGELDQFFAPLKSKLARQTNLREWARGLYDDADAARSFEASGDRFTVLIGPRSNVSTVDVVALIKKVGIKIFCTFAKTTLKDLGEHVSADVAASVVSVAQTGFRTVTSFERGTQAPPAKKAA